MDRTRPRAHRRVSPSRFKLRVVRPLLAAILAIVLIIAIATPLPPVSARDAPEARLRRVARHQGRSENLNQLELARRQNSKVSPLCKKPTIRREWFTLTDEQRKAWSDAFLRLFRRGNSIFLKGGSVMDDIAVLHTAKNLEFHFNAQFLVWHTCLLRLFYNYMRMAGYDGPEVYLDTTKNWGQGQSNSPIWGPNHLGGDGHGGPIPDGPFAGTGVNVTASAKSLIKPIYFPAKVSRSFNPSWRPDPTNKVQDSVQTGSGGNNDFAFVGTDLVDEIFKFCSYSTYRPLIEQLPHGTFHYGVRGNMYLTNAPSDAIFWLLHGGIDWLWRSIQAGCGNYYDYRGPRYQVDWKGPSSGTTGQQVSLDDQIDFLGLVAKVSAREAMHPRQGILCYEYDQLYVPAWAKNGRSKRSGQSAQPQDQSQGADAMLQNKLAVPPNGDQNNKQLDKDSNKSDGKHQGNHGGHASGSSSSKHLPKDSNTNAAEKQKEQATKHSAADKEKKDAEKQKKESHDKAKSESQHSKDRKGSNDPKDHGQY